MCIIYCTYDTCNPNLCITCYVDTMHINYVDLLCICNGCIYVSILYTQICTPPTMYIHHHVSSCKHTSCRCFGYFVHIEYRIVCIYCAINAHSMYLWRRYANTITNTHTHTCLSHTVLYMWLQTLTIYVICLYYIHYIYVWIYIYIYTGTYICACVCVCYYGFICVYYTICDMHSMYTY